MALLNYNSAGAETQSSFDPIPNNWYNVIMTGSEMKPTKANDGAYLECVLKVVDGDFAGRLLWLRLNLDNQNAQAVEIAYKQLASICQATGVIQVKDSSELHGKPFSVKVTVRPPKGDYEASNEIKGFKPCEGKAQSGQAQSSTTSKSTSPAWAKKEEKKEEPVNEQQIEKAVDTTVEKEPVEQASEASAKPPWMQ